jgi:hypothetical protein
MPTSHTARRLSAVFAILAVTGCSQHVAYESGQAWQRQECNKLADFAERQRCIDKANASYDRYQRQTEELKTKPAP